jgi:hypothetical protein
MKIPVGATAYIGPPAKPIPKEISDAIGAGLGKIPEILEAHLPMVYIKGHIDPVPRQNSVRARKSTILHNFLNLKICYDYGTCSTWPG